MRRIAWLIADRLLPVVLLLLPFLWFAGRIPPFSWHPLWLLVPPVLAIVRTANREGSRGCRGWMGTLWVQRSCMAVIMPFLILLTAEAGLALVKFDKDVSPIVFDSKDEEDHGNKRVLSDPVLLFKFIPGTVYNKVRINSLGYREREVNPVKQPNTRRIISLGDSVTAQGRPGYSSILHEMLQAEPPDPSVNWEAFNMGVYGYSIRQGFQVFMDQARQLEPDYITIYFGMNDRNLHEMMDKDRMGRRVSGVSGFLSARLREHRVGKFLLHAGQEFRMARYRTAETPKVPRVPPDDYEYVLRRFHEEARKIGCTPIYITAPRRDFSLVSVQKGNAVSREAILARHDAYNDIVRKVAADTGSELLDLAKMLEPEEYDHFFAHDGIHFDSYGTEHHPEPPKEQPGLTFIARAIYDVIARTVRP